MGARACVPVPVQHDLVSADDAILTLVQATLRLGGLSKVQIAVAFRAPLLVEDDSRALDVVAVAIEVLAQLMFSRVAGEVTDVQGAGGVKTVLLLHSLLRRSVPLVIIVLLVIATITEAVVLPAIRGLGLLHVVSLAAHIAIAVVMLLLIILALVIIRLLLIGVLWSVLARLKILRRLVITFHLSF